MPERTKMVTPYWQPTQDDFGERWERAKSYFRKRKRVIFISYCRFFERHAFVQQSLAQWLVEAGVEVVWLDGVGWKPYSPSFYWSSPLLKVEQLFRYPGERFRWIRELNHAAQLKQVERHMKSTTLIWIQGGIDESLVRDLPYVDVFSTFDDPYRHAPNGTLCGKAKVIICQNSVALEILQPSHPTKIVRLFPPLEINEETFDSSAAPKLPATFPKRVMGYVGSFFSHDFDLVLFEYLVRSLPHRGFLLAGRTDEAGLRHVERLHSLPNFVYLPWVPRSQVAALWKMLDVTLLLYRPCRTQNGAFPTKILESFYFGVPCVSTSVPKTRDLEGVCLRSSLPSALKEGAEELIKQTPLDLERKYVKWAREMHPTRQLIEVAERLGKLKTRS